MQGAARWEKEWVEVCIYLSYEAGFFVEGYPNKIVTFGGPSGGFLYYLSLLLFFFNFSFPLLPHLPPGLSQLLTLERAPLHDI